MKKKILSFLTVVCMTFSSLFLTGCSLFDIFKGDKDFTAEDYFKAAKASGEKTEYTIKYTSSTQYLDNEDSEPQVSVSYLLKESDGFYTVSEDEEESIITLWEKVTNAGSTYYAGNILIDYGGYDTLGSMTEQKMSDDYGTVGNVISAFTASNMADLFGVTMPEGEVMVEGTYTHKIETKDDSGVLTLDIQDYILELDFSGHKSYQKFNGKLEFTFDEEYVNKVVIDFVESRQKKNSDNTYSDDTGVFSGKTREISTYEMTYSFDENKIAKAKKAMELFEILDVSALKSEYTFTTDYEATNVSGYTTNGKLYELNIKTTYGSAGYFATGDVDGDAEVYGHIYSANSYTAGYSNSFICDGEKLWCDGMGSNSPTQIAESFGNLYKVGPFMRDNYNTIHGMAYSFLEFDVGATDLYIDTVEEYPDVEYTVDFSTLSNGDKVATITVNENVISKVKGYQDEVYYKKSGVIEIVYDTLVKEMKITSTEKEVELENDEYVETGKVKKFTNKYTFSYSYDSTVIDWFPEEYR